MTKLEILKPKNIFKVDGDVYFIPVNTFGIMGAGIAKEFKERFPELYERYKKDCKKHVISIGNPVMYFGPNEKYYVMFPTKENWRNPSQLSWIINGLLNFTELIKEELSDKHILVIPPLGCGKGKLNFNNVKEAIEEFDRQVPNMIKLVEPF